VSSEAYTFRKEKSVKIVELDVHRKGKATNAALGHKRPNVLDTARTKMTNGKRHKTPQDPNDIDEGIDSSSDEAASEDNQISEEEGEDNDNDDEIDPITVGVAMTASGQTKGSRGRNERVISANEVRAHLSLLFQREAEICTVLFSRHGSTSTLMSKTAVPSLANMFFLEVLPVTPSRFRPAARMGDELFEDSQNSLLAAVLTTIGRLRDLNQRLVDMEKAERGEIVLDKVVQIEGGNTFSLLLDALIRLQNDVNSYFDSSKNPTIMRQGKEPPPGIKQILEKKDGLFRKHMMVSVFILCT
jgi:DNA-directed RNA polymerase I subunit RPA1